LKHVVREQNEIRNFISENNHALKKKDKNAISASLWAATSRLVM